jgi:23S rRNA pseudouridine1911/1915/1917 synthase
MPEHLEILFEDNHLIAVNKAVSDIVQRDKTGDDSLEDKIKTFIAKRDKKPGNVFLGISHRLDRPVTGVVIFAKTSKALSRMNEMFKNKEVQKVYWAIVKEEPPAISADLEHNLSRNEKQNKAYIRTKPGQDTKLASLSYTVISRSDNYYLLEVKLHTGRHHQIRAQLAHIGCPVKGDLKYGFPRSNKNGGISLHARSIRFIHPVRKEEIFIEAPVPREDIFNVFGNINRLAN